MKEVKTSDDLMAQIVEICSPKFCGDTSVIINAHVKIFGLKDEKGNPSNLNGLTGWTCHPFLFSKPTNGQVGIELTPFQKVSIEGNRVNVPAENLMFIP